MLRVSLKPAAERLGQDCKPSERRFAVVLDVDGRVRVEASLDLEAVQ